MKTSHTTGLQSAVLVTAFILLLLVTVLMQQDITSISALFFYIQDCFVGAGIIAVLLATLAWRPILALPRRLPSSRQVAVAAVILASVLWFCTYAIMYNYPLTRDEHMVVFDLQIYRTGKLAQPLDSRWFGYAKALVPAFLLDVPDHRLLVSAYMPMNAAIRAAVSLVVDPALMNPMLTALGLLLIHRLARRLFPDSTGAVWTALLGYLLSTQILVNAMTDYAMAGHLFLNLLWLNLFLDGRRAAYASAMAVAFVAIGYHQVIFHLLFAAPFIFGLALERKWRLFWVFCFGYVAAGAFWITYPHLVTSLAGIQIDSSSAAGADPLVLDRFMPLLLQRDPFTVQKTLFNLLRTFAWAPLFLGPLLIMALPSVRERQGIAPELASGLALTFVAMVIVLPNQGHGWGYRYFHPVMGNLLLLTGYGYQRAAAGQAAMADRLVIIPGAATLALAIPFLCWTTHTFVEPYARLTALIGRQKADFVIVDTSLPSTAIDQVRNVATLSNRPLVFSSKHLSDQQVVQLCRRGSVTVIGSRQFVKSGFGQHVQPSAATGTLESRLVSQHCLRPTN